MEPIPDTAWMTKNLRLDNSETKGKGKCDWTTEETVIKWLLMSCYTHRPVPCKTIIRVASTWSRSEDILWYIARLYAEWETLEYSVLNWRIVLMHPGFTPIDEDLQLKVSFSQRQFLGKQTTLKCSPHGYQQMANSKWTHLYLWRLLL